MLGKIKLYKLFFSCSLVSEERSGYRVNQTLPEDYFKIESTQENLTQGNHSTFEWRVVRKPDPLKLLQKIRQKKGLFKGSTPDPRLFPMDEFRSHMMESLKYFPKEILGYSANPQHQPLINALEEYLRKIRSITGRQIIITHGSQEAIFLSAQLLIQAGDYVAVGELGYPSAWEAIRAAGAKLVPIQCDDEGIDPDSLLELVNKHQIHMIYLTPLHQFPTSITLSEERRKQIYEIASKYKIPILEDDYDHEFHYKTQPPAPLASHDPDQLIIYISTFSKILFPSARIGFMAVPENILDAFLRYRQIMNFQNEPIIQDAISS